MLETEIKKLREAVEENTQTLRELIEATHSEAKTQIPTSEVVSTEAPPPPPGDQVEPTADLPPPPPTEPKAENPPPPPVASAPPPPAPSSTPPAPPPAPVVAPPGAAQHSEYWTYAFGQISRYAQEQGDPRIMIALAQEAGVTNMNTASDDEMKKLVTLVEARKAQ